MKYIKVTLQDADVSKLRAEIEKVGFINNDDNWLVKHILDRVDQYPTVVEFHIDKLGEIVVIRHIDKNVIERQIQAMEKENEERNNNS